MKMCRKIALTFCVCLCFTSVHASIIYDQKSAFFGNLNEVVVDDFENVAYQVSPSSLFNILTDSKITSVLNETKYTALDFKDTNIVYDLATLGLASNYVYCAGCNGAFNLDFTSTSVSSGGGVFGIGFDYFNRNPNALQALFVTFADNSEEYIPLDQVFDRSNLAFLGITSETAISNIRFDLALDALGGGQTFSLDNLTIGNSISVPEPASILLLGLGILGIKLRRKRY